MDIMKELERKQKVLNVSERMHRIRDIVRKLYGKNFQENLKPYKDLILAAMEKKGLSTLDAAMEMVEYFQKNRGSEASIMHILAACIEMIDPSDTET